jgi:dTDP-4-amino-4,6-dideoxygalactose transaminase
MRSTFLPFSLPDTGNEEINEITEAIHSGWVTTGPKTHQFEVEFASYVGAKHAIAVNSCTAAMHLALEAIGIKAKDEVITTPLTFAATAEVIRYFDAIPVLVDIDPFTLNIDPTKIESVITPRSRAIMPVHLAGLPVQMSEINAIAFKYNLKIVEDAAHALPTLYRGNQDGSPGNIVCFSFYATKPITTGEGGMICTENDTWANRCRFMSLHGITHDAWKRYTIEGTWYYEILAPGYKYNMTDLAAAMGLAQLKKVEQMWQRRRTISEKYSLAFSSIAALQTPPDAPLGIRHAWHLYILRLNLNQLSIDRNQFIEELKSRHIGTSVHFIPLHIHPYYRENYGYMPEDYPIAYHEYKRMISLPIYSRMTDQDTQDVIEAVSEIVDYYQKK